MPLHLVDLPDDILFEIISYFEFSKPDLLSLIRVHPRFYFEARRYLFRYATFEGIGPAASGPQFPLFRRSITENPGIASLVHSVHVECQYRLEYVAETTANPVMRILPTLPNLKHFGFRCHYHPRCGSALPVVLKKCRLQSITMDLHLYHATPTQQLLCLPTLETLNLPGKFIFIDTDSETLCKHGTTKSNLKTLRLGRVGLPSHDLICCIFLYTPQVQHLTLRLSPGAYRMLKPSAISTTLTRALPNLRELDIIDNGDSWPQGTDSTKADFSQLSHLRKLRLAPGLWFSWAAFSEGAHRNIDRFIGRIWEKEDRRGVYRLLPPSLEDLEIFFHFDSALFVLGSMFLNAFQKKPVVPPAGYAWIMELATNKSLHFPGLRFVRLVEERYKEVSEGYSAGQSMHFEPLPWNLPAELRDAFQEAGVKLDVQLRSNYRILER